jgi:hypothetical protein
MLEAILLLLSVGSCALVIVAFWALACSVTNGASVAKPFPCESCYGNIGAHLGAASNRLRIRESRDPTG